MDVGNPPLQPIKAGRVALIDAKIGNIDSVVSGMRYLGVDFRIASSAADLAGVSHIVLPGVGAFKAGMAALEDHGLVGPLRAVARMGSTRLLGICLGMQLLGEHSEEGDCGGLGVMPFQVQRLRRGPIGMCKVPHVGFTTVTGFRNVGLFADLGRAADFYFTHSFAAYDLRGNANIGSVRYGHKFIAAFDAGHICGAQFHPEKSQSNGLLMLRNFFEQ